MMQKTKRDIYFNLLLFNFASQLYLWSVLFYFKPQYLISIFSILFKSGIIFVITQLEFSMLVRLGFSIPI